MKEMVYSIPLGACPICGHRKFIISEYQMNEYLTNLDGEIIDMNLAGYNAKGICCNCNNVFEMYDIGETFIPLTKLRKLLLDYL